MNIAKKWGWPATVAFAALIAGAVCAGIWGPPGLWEALVGAALGQGFGARKRGDS